MSAGQEQNNTGNTPYHDDEIDLVDIGVTLVRHRTLIIVIVAIFMALGIFVALRKQPSYNYVASISPASYVTPDGKLIQALSSESASALLTNGLIDQAIIQYADKHQINARRIKIKVSSPLRSDVVLLSGRGNVKLQDAYIAIERSAAELLAKSTSHLIDSYRSGIQAALEHAKLGLANLQDPQQIQIEKSGLQENLLSAQAALANLVEQHKVLVDKRSNLNHSVKLYEGLAKNLDSYIAKARNETLASANAKTPVEAMTAMLLGNQVQQNLRQLTDLQEKLTVTLPQEIAQVQAAIANNEQQQLTQKTAAEQAKIQYDNYQARHERKIQTHQINIDNLQSQLASVKETKLVSEPTRSAIPVGISKKVIAVLATIVGMFIALIAVFIAEFSDAVRRKYRAEGGGA